MAIEVKMPQLGESVLEGTIGKWLKKEGDTVEKYEPILEVITDKVDTEVTAVESGTLLRILVPEGETVTVGTVLALIGEAGEEIAAGPAAEPAAAPAIPVEPAATPPSARPEHEPPPATPPPAPAEAPSPPPRVSPVAARMAAAHGIDLTAVTGTGPGGQITRQDVERQLAAQSEAATAGRAPEPEEEAAAVPEPATEPEAEAPPAAPPAPEAPPPAEPPAASAPEAPPPAAPEEAPPRRDLGFISPRVARLAAEHGVDLRQVTGTGRDGRITARDVERFIARRQAAGARQVPAEPGPPAGAPEPAAPAPEAPITPGIPAAMPSPAVGEIIELTPMRRAIAEHMVRSKHTAPHVTTVHEVDMSAVIAAREVLKGQFAERGIKLTYTAFLVHATAQALTEHPIVNSSWTDSGIQIHREINIGVAVALDRGLIVPVIRNADQKSLMGLARDVNDLAGRARNRQLVPDDVQGGTFTITNYGTLGSLFGTPVINQPQTAILGAGAIRKQVVVVEGPHGDTIAIRPMMYLSLTFDHRVLDGGLADPFVQAIVRRLENYEV